MSELSRVETFLYSKLSGAAGLTALVSTRIFSHLAPKDAAEPLVVYEMTSAQDEQSQPAARQIVMAEYTVRGIARGASMAQATAVADAIDAALHGATGTVSSKRVMCRRVSAVAYVTTEDAIRFNHAGGVYELTIEA